MKNIEVLEFLESLGFDYLTSTIDETPKSVEIIQGFISNKSDAKVYFTICLKSISTMRLELNSSKEEILINKQTFKSVEELRSLFSNCQELKNNFNLML